MLRPPPPSSTISRGRLLHDNLQLSFQDNPQHQQQWQGGWQGERRIRRQSSILHSTLTPPEQQQLQDTPNEAPSPKRTVNIVLVTGFESFNRDLYIQAGQLLPRELVDNVRLTVFADSDIRASTSSSSTDDEATAAAEVEAGVTNNEFAKAVQNADIFIASLIFDYDDVVTVSKLLDQQQLAAEEAEVKAEQQQQLQQQQQQQHPKKIRLLFECATELMSYNQVGSFTINQSSTEGGGGGGPPPAIKAILNKFSSGKEEDKINGYLKMLKVGPDLLKFIPG